MCYNYNICGIRHQGGNFLDIDLEDFIAEQFITVQPLGHRSSHKIVQIKDVTTGELMVKKELDCSADTIKIIKNLNAPYFPQIYYIIERTRTTTVIEEYIEGEPLDKSKFSALSERIKIRLLHQLCDAVELMHQHDIIHRDIKPSNVLLTNDCRIKVIDFDSARIKSAYADSDTRFLGTPGFAPPEQYGFAQTDARADIYALGQLIKSVWSDQLPASLSRIARRCTRFDPQQRYSTVAQLKKALKYFKYRRYFAASAIAIVMCCLFVGLVLNPKPTEVISSPSHVPTQISMAEDSKPPVSPEAIADNVPPSSAVMQPIAQAPYTWDANGISIPVLESDMSYYSGLRVKSNEVIYMLDSQIDSYRSNTRWLMDGEIYPDMNGIYKIAPNQQFIDAAYSNGKWVIDIYNDSDTILENVSVFIGLHDASVCSGGVRKDFIASHGKNANSACAQSIYKCLGNGTIPPDNYKSILIDPLGSELYSPYAGITCYIAIDDTCVYTDHCSIYPFQ